MYVGWWPWNVLLHKRQNNTKSWWLNRKWLEFWPRKKKTNPKYYYWSPIVHFVVRCIKASCSSTDTRRPCTVPSLDAAGRSVARASWTSATWRSACNCASKGIVGVKVEEISNKSTFHVNQYFWIKFSKVVQDMLKLIIMKKSKSQSD